MKKNISKKSIKLLKCRKKSYKPFPKDKIPKIPTVTEAILKEINCNSDATNDKNFDDGLNDINLDIL